MTYQAGCRAILYKVDAKDITDKLDIHWVFGIVILD